MDNESQVCETGTKATGVAAWSPGAEEETMQPALIRQEAEGGVLLISALLRCMQAGMPGLASPPPPPPLSPRLKNHQEPSESQQVPPNPRYPLPAGLALALQSSMQKRRHCKRLPSGRKLRAACCSSLLCLPACKLVRLVQHALSRILRNIPARSCLLQMAASTWAMGIVTSLNARKVPTNPIIPPPPPPPCPFAVQASCRRGVASDSHLAGRCG